MPSPQLPTNHPPKYINPAKLSNHNNHPHCSGISLVNPKSQNPTKTSDIISLIDGPDLSGMVKLWEDIAAGEARLNLLAKLQEKKLGFSQIEKFSLGLKYCLKSNKLQEENKKPIQKVVQAAMALKMRDEAELLKEKKREREGRRESDI